MYKIKFSQKAAKQYLAFPEKIRKQIDIKLETLSQDPYGSNHNIKPLLGIGILKCYRLRVGDLRIIYHIMQDNLIIYIIKVAHRKEVYRL